MEHGARSIPSVDRLLRDLGPSDLPRPAVVAVVRRELAAVRAAAGGGVPAADVAAVLARVRAALDDLRRSRLRVVLNGTGIIIHTNFGRSPLGPAAIEAVARAGANYTNLEFDLSAGGRGGRGAYVEHNLALLCGAESAAVVNNCAAALVLILRHFLRPPGQEARSEVVISRGELVQIGGGFRVPDILQSSGATLREVGTTNQTTADDYARALGPATALVLKVHRSNFYMGGFVESPPTAAVAAIARRAGVPFAEDLGSGATFPTGTVGRGPGAGAGGAGDSPAEHEPTPAETLGQGADLVCFSGDKLLGGPQAGVIAGGAARVLDLKRDPFFRALRCDKLILAALGATVDAHLDGAPGGIPVLDLMRVPNDALEARAERLVNALVGLPVKAAVGAGEARVGGGALPRTVIPSVTLDLMPHDLPPDRLAARLRRGAPPVVGYVGGGRLRIDLRTIFPGQDDALLAALRAALHGPATGPT